MSPERSVTYVSGTDKDNDGGRYRIRTYDFHRVKLTANGKQRTSEESSVIPSSVNRALGAPSNENCAQICTPDFKTVSGWHHHRNPRITREFLQDRPRRRGSSEVPNYLLS